MQFRSREERLRELEKERALFNQTKKQLQTQPQNHSTNSYSTENLAGSFSNFDLNEKQQEYITSPLNFKNFESSQTTDDACFYDQKDQIRNKIRFKPNSVHTFFDEIPNLAVSVSSPVETPTPAKMKEKLDAVSPVRKKSVTATSPSTSDPWARLLAKETKSRGKYYANDKTLLVLLEEERVKYQQLETEYHKLLTEVQLLQTNHVNDARNQEKKYSYEVSKLQKLLVSKSQELATTSGELKSLQSKYTRESLNWNEANLKLEAHLEKMNKLFHESDSQVASQEKSINELLKIKKELENALHNKELQLKKNESILKEREVEYMKEKEGRMKLEIKVLQLDHFLTQRDEDNKALNSKISRKEREFMELQEQASLKEKKYIADINELRNQLESTKSELSQLQNTSNIEKEDIERLTIQESKLKLNIEVLHKKNADQSEEINKLKSLSKHHHEQISKQQADLNEAKTLNEELRATLSQCEQDLGQLRASYDHYKRDQSDYLHQQDQIIKSKNQELFDCENYISELTKKLEFEVKATKELKQQQREQGFLNQDKLDQVTTKLLNLTQQLDEKSQVENQLRLILKQKEDAIHSLNTRIAELQSNIGTLQNLVNREQSENESLKNRKKDEINQLLEKYNQAKGLVESENQQLKAQQNQKSQLVLQLQEELSRLKLDVSELTSDKFRLESRISELLASESSLQRQLASVSSTLSQREQETVLVSLKQSSLVEQIKRLEDEIKIYRDAQEKKDHEVGRLQSNVNDLSRKLRSQVDLLMLDKDMSTKRSLSKQTSFQSGFQNGFQIPVIKTPEVKNSEYREEYNRSVIGGLEDWGDDGSVFLNTGSRRK